MEVSLKEYFEARLKNIEDSVKIARDAMEKRLEGMNEFRNTLSDQTKNFISRPEYNKLSEEIAELKQFKATIESKADQSSVDRIFSISLVSIGIAIIAIIVNLLRK